MRGQCIIYISLFLALILEVMPLPIGLNSWRPAWVFIAVLYWIMALPHRVSIGHAFFLGIFLDVAMGIVLGVNALSFALSAYIITINYKRIRNYSLWQQAMIIAALFIFNRLVYFLSENIVNNDIFSFELLKPVLLTSILWPWIFLFFRKIRREFRIT